MPVTLQFGPWAPDQADTPIQIPDTAGPLPVPCADCLNVIYTNGNYRSIASPSNATINGNNVQVLNAQPVNAFSYFDQVGRQETVFVGTGSGVQSLNPDGSWSTVNLVTTQITQLIGQAMTFKFGTFQNVNTMKGQKLSFTTGALTAVVTGHSIVAGHAQQNDQGSITRWVGYNQSAASPTIGSIANVDPFSFGTLETLQDMYSTGPTVAVFAVVSPADPTQTAFGTMTIGSVTQTSTSASYSYSASGHLATWVFPLPFGFTSGTTYTAVLA
jgi:hypothetical protein